MLQKDGVATMEQIKSSFPELEKLSKPKVIIECYENIPCNPCSTSCPFDAITIGKDINDLPKVDFDKCTGCGNCVFSCPGLAIKIAQIVGEFARFKIPYEFLPYPIASEEWDAVNREGKVIGKAIIEKTFLNNRQDHTMIVQVLVDKNLIYDFATIRRRA